MAVPGHDERDFEFAAQFKLPILQVVAPSDGDEIDLPYLDHAGVVVNSAQFDGLTCTDAIEKVTTWLAEKKLGVPRLQYRLHDWCISRQRYWGPPIPMIYC